ncbi:MAG: exodeoxyribonuclease VII small subunit [Planctomycetes bacterium]|nr:exodeoxyribonuclease VII small subunit [Planctomycetota bacterium]
MSDKKAKKSAEPSYAEATTELDEILRDIESGEIDLDELSEKVERAATLLALCRKKLLATEVKVKKAVDEVAAAMDADDGESATAAEDER